MDKWSFLQESDTGVRLYLAVFLINVLGESLGTTMFPMPGKFLLLIKLGSVALLGIKLLWFDYLQIKELVCYGGLIGLTMLIWISSGYSEVLMWGLLLIGAKNVPFRKILQIYLVVNVTVVFLAFSASLLGVIENLQYVSNISGRIRNSFGIIYTTDFAAHIFYLMLVWFYLRRDRLKKWDYFGAAVLAALVYYFCNTRLDVICMLLIVLGYMWIGLQRKVRQVSLNGKYVRKSLWEKYGMYSMPVAAAVMTGLTVLYGRWNILRWLNELLTDRLNYGFQGLEQYGITLFGQYVLMIGNGNTTGYQPDYFFVDCSYLYVLLRYGILFLLILLGIYVMCCKKYRNNVYFIMTIALVSLNCMIAHHIIETAYNPFAWALFAAIDEETKDVKS